MITRPRRFGKTMGMNMLESFFDIRKDSRKLFEGLEIAGHQVLCYGISFFKKRCMVKKKLAN